MDKYLIKSLEHVYGAFDEYEHANALKPLVVEANSITDAAQIGGHMPGANKISMVSPDLRLI
jgi:hypothetical protein